MSACATQTFTNVNQTVWNCLVQQAQQYGVTITQPQGSGSNSGFTVSWNWNSAAQTLSIQCTDSPFWAPCSTINGKIHDIVTGCGAAQSVAMST